MNYDQTTLSLLRHPFWPQKLILQMILKECLHHLTSYLQLFISWAGADPELNIISG